MSTTDAVIRPRPVPDPRLRLFVLHHAGASHVPYRAWAGHLPPDWELCLLEAPGRGTRHGTPARTAGDLAGILLEDVRPWTDRPYAVFGHSMGAIAGYELTLALRDHGLPLPCWLGLSSARAPEHHPRRDGRRFDLPDAELRSVILEMGGTPREVLEEPGLWGYLEPILRADLQLVDTWQPRTGAVPLPVPLSVFSGAADKGALPHLMDTWAAHTSRFAGAHVLDGGHFYFQPDPSALIHRIVTDIRGNSVPGGEPFPVEGTL
ncbi:thioesterase II family protein [Streptomyces sp. NPDC001404]|uniref:thioesterase II family protein n=1 Tax=Streptomyces sp. NPDC001404 TaxID=3364571 RepID=UPI0036C1306A